MATFGPGRKANSVGKRFSVMAWFQALSQATGLTAGQMGKRYLPDLLSSEHASNIFYKYRNGSAFPEKNYCLIEMQYINLEIEWLHGDLFKLIDNRSLTSSDLCGGFSNQTINGLVAEDYWKHGLNFLTLREDADWLERLCHIRRLDNLEAFSAMMMILRQCQLVGRLGFVYQYGCYLLLDMWRLVYFHPVLGPFSENLFIYLQIQFCHGRLPLDLSGNKWGNIDDIHAQRIQCARNEKPGWEPSKAMISSQWFREYLNRKKANQPR